MMAEKSARIRFGDEYVDSYSQKIYNEIYKELMYKILEEEIDQKLIFMHDENLSGDYGFTQDKYIRKSSREREADIHCNKLFWSFMVKKLF